MLSLFLVVTPERVSMSIFSSSYWQGIGAILGLLGALASPLLTILYDRLLGKKEHQQHVNAYKALLLPDLPLSVGEFFRCLSLQPVPPYLLSISFLRLLLFHPPHPIP